MNGFGNAILAQIAGSIFILNKLHKLLFLFLEYKEKVTLKALAPGLNWSCVAPQRDFLKSLKWKKTHCFPKLV